MIWSHRCVRCAALHTLLSSLGTYDICETLAPPTTSKRATLSFLRRRDRGWLSYRRRIGLNMTPGPGTLCSKAGVSLSRRRSPPWMGEAGWREESPLSSPMTT